MKRFFMGLLLAGYLFLFPTLTFAQVSSHLSWNTYFGQRNMTFTDNAVDSKDHVIFVGKGFQSLFPTHNPGLGAYFQAGPIGSDDGVIAKFDSLGQLVWSTYYGSSGGDHINGVATNSQDHIFVVGDGGGGSFPLTDPGNGAYFDNTRGAVDGLITRFDPQGRVVWSTYFGGSSNDYITDIAIAENDNFWITGYTRSADFPTQAKTGAYFDGSLGGFRDWFVAKFDANGKLLYSTYYGTTNNNDYAYKIACSPTNGNVAVCGSLQGTPANITPAGAYASPWSHQGMILEFDSTGQHIWATRFLSGHIAYDSSGNLFYGARWPNSYPTSVPLANPGGGALSQGYPSFVNRANTGVHYFAKFDVNRALVWGTCAYQSANANQVVNIYDIAIDQNQQLVAVGRATHGLYRVNTGGYYQSSRAGGFDGTIQVFSNNGVPMYGSYFGGNGSNGAEDYMYTVAVNSGNEYLTGGVTRTLSCSNQNIPTRNPGNAYYDGISTPSTPGSLLPMISRFSPNAVSGVSNHCVESFLSITFPVEWQEVRASRLSEAAVSLQWSTASETNNHYFEIERGIDGRSFSYVGKIYSEGDSQEPQSYSFLDENAHGKRYYYRIRQIDLDGSFSYSKTVDVAFTPEARTSLFVEQAHLYIRSTLPIQRIECWSLTGSQMGTTSPQHTSYRWPTAHLPAGMYVFKVYTEDGLHLLKAQVR